MADVTRLLADNNISIESMLQKEPDSDSDSVPVILLTHRVKEHAVNSAIKAIQSLDSIKEPVMRIRVEQLE